MKLRTRDPQQMARIRVRRGVRWLDQYAPADWRVRMFTISGQRIVFPRARSSYDNQCHLALAFEPCHFMANELGYVTFATVANFFDLSKVKTIALGFDAEPVRGDDARDTITALLDDAWTEALFSYALPSSSVQCHDVRPQGPITKKELRRIGEKAAGEADRIFDIIMAPGSLAGQLIRLASPANRWN